MKYICDNAEYKRFICYRRKEGKDLRFAPSEDIAGIVHWFLNYDPEFASCGPVLFEECYPASGTLTYDEDGIKYFMPQMETCFVMLCDGFFERVLETYSEVLEDYGALSEEEKLEKTRELLRGSQRDVCYLEIKYALENGVRLCPIIISRNGDDFFSRLSQRKRNNLEKILGKGSGALFNKINAHTVFYDQHIALHMQDIRWRTAEEEEVRELIHSLEEEEAVQSLREYLKEVVCLCGNTEDGTACCDQGSPDNRALDSDCCDQGRIEWNIKQDLKLCATTFFDQQRPGPGEKNFSASDPNVVFDPVRIQYAEDAEPPFLAACLVEEFEKNQEAFSLPTDTFCYWDVELDSDMQDPEKISLSVCSVCFGILCTYHRLYKDSQLLEDGRITEANRRPLLDTIQSGINLLLALRNPYTKTWPSSWAFNKFDGIIGVEGTTNQTTLSLSTLMSCGFLSPDEDIPVESLKARYSYIWDSVKVLRKWGKLTNRYDSVLCKGWRYTEKHTRAAVLPTVFAFDTLRKLRQNIAALVEHFRTTDPAFCQELQTHAGEVDHDLTLIIRFLKKEQVTVSTAPGAFKRYEDTEFSVTHTAYVIKSLCQYAPQCRENIKKELEEILEPSVEYLLEAMVQMLETGEMHFADWERFENFCDVRRKGSENRVMKSTSGERYEHCAELIIAEALIKIAEYTGSQPIREKVMALLNKMFDIYFNSESIVRDHDTICIESARPEELHYPIYYLYYYRMFLWDYLSLLKKKEG